LQLIREPIGTSGLKVGAAEQLENNHARLITDIISTALRKEEMVV
jgi:hypothetical protein